MKVVVACIFIILYGVALLRPLSPLIEYHANRDLFAAFCVNKERPERACNGQCVLMQKLKELQQPAAADPVLPSDAAPKIDLKEYPIGFVQVLHLLVSASHAISLARVGYCEAMPDQVVFSIFHPPS